MTALGILLLAAGLVLHAYLKGTGDLVTLVVIVIGALMIDPKRFGFLKRQLAVDAWKSHRARRDDPDNGGIS